MVLVRAERPSKYIRIKKGEATQENSGLLPKSTWIFGFAIKSDNVLP